MFHSRAPIRDDIVSRPSTRNPGGSLSFQVNQEPDTPPSTGGSELMSTWSDDGEWGAEPTKTTEINNTEDNE